MRNGFYKDKNIDRSLIKYSISKLIEKMIWDICLKNIFKLSFN